MENRRKIMTIGVIGHVDHGKTTLIHAIHKSLADIGHDVVLLSPEEKIPEVDPVALGYDPISSFPSHLIEQAAERRRLERAEVMQLRAPVDLTHFRLPATRRERRAQARRNK